MTTAKEKIQAAFGPALTVTHVSDRLAHMLTWLEAHPGQTVADYQAAEPDAAEEPPDYFEGWGIDPDADDSTYRYGDEREPDDEPEPYDYRAGGRGRSFEVPTREPLTEPLGSFRGYRW
jgi:hypothetical protein